MIYAALGREAPNCEGFDAQVFVQIYNMLAECKGRELSRRELRLYWKPMLMEVRKMRGVPATDPISDDSDDDFNNIDVDVDMEGGEDSDWEVGSGVGSEDGEDGIDGEQNEG